MEYVQEILIFAIILSHIFIVFLILSYISKKLFKKDIYLIKGIKDSMKKNFLLYSFIISLFSVLGSLYYSLILNYEPCILCWYQRMIIFPLPIIFLVALIKKDRNIKNYIYPLISIGSLIAIYNIIVERTGSSFCDALSSAPCNILYVNEFGYITIPVMSLTLFILLFILMLNSEST